MDGLNSNASTLTILINFPPLELSVKLTSGDKDKSNRIMAQRPRINELDEVKDERRNKG